MIGLAGALQNRCVTSFLTSNVDRVLADFERIIQIAREYRLLDVRVPARSGIWARSTSCSDASTRRCRTSAARSRCTASSSARRRGIVFAVEVLLARITGLPGRRRGGGGDRAGA